MFFLTTLKIINKVSHNKINNKCSKGQSNKICICKFYSFLFLELTNQLLNQNLKNKNCKHHKSKLYYFITNKNLLFLNLFILTPLTRRPELQNFMTSKKIKEFCESFF